MNNHFKSILHIGILFAVLISLVGSALIISPARANSTITVNGSTDVGGLAMTTDGICSLREAVANANMNSQQFPNCPAGSGTDTITFAGNYTITLTQGQLLVTSPIVINGNGAANTVVQVDTSAFQSRVFEVGASGNLTLNNLTVRNGSCNSSASPCSTSAIRGGGIYNAGTLVVSGSTLSGNSANAGGGIFNVTGATLTVLNSTFSGNSASGTGGGIQNEGSLTVTNSTLSGNSAGNGGGIQNFGNVTIINSTLAGNNAVAVNGYGGYGGGIYTAGTLTITNSTLAGNSAYSINGGGIYSLNQTAGGVTNTIIANSPSGGNCINFSGGNGSYSLSSDNTCGFGAGGTNVSVLLGPLADNGGPTQTMALLTGSPAIDAGNDASCPNTDQRGATRPQGAHCDIGAFEADPPPQLTPSTNSLNFGNQMVGQVSSAQTVQVTNDSSFAVQIGTLVIEGDFNLNGDNCSNVALPADASCSFGVTFLPSSTGLKNGSVTIPSDDVPSPATVSLYGTGVAPELGLDTTSLNFGSAPVGMDSNPQTVTVTSTGNLNLVVGVLSITGEYALTNDNCSGQTVTPGNTCTFGVIFHPISTGSKSGSVSIPSNAASSPDSVALNGSGVVATTASFTSLGAYDGHIQESGEDTSVGGKAVPSGSILSIGDGVYDRQFRGILHFDTSSLPDAAVITNLTLRLKRSGIVGTNPFNTHGSLLVDVVTPYFGISSRLEVSDFQFAPSAFNVGFFNPVPGTGNWFTANLDPAAFPYLNLTGTTQFRLAFSLDDNDDNQADYLKFFSGNHFTSSYRPQLIVQYYVP